MEAAFNRQQYTPTSYALLALRWQPVDKSDRIFNILVAVALLLGLLLGLLLSTAQLPVKPKRERVLAPERVAQFIRQQAIELPPPPKAKPQPAEPKPPPPKPEVTQTPARPEPRPQPERRPQQPLTEQQQRARENAQRSGLLAHANELRDLMDTPDVSAQVKTGLRNTPQSAASAPAASGLNTGALTAGVARGSGGVDASRYTTRAGSASLAAAEATATQAALEASADAFTQSASADSNRRVRSEEEVTLVFDRHKSQLQAIYNRARRTNPALKGKLVLAVTIQPNGAVSAVKVVSSELQDQSLVDSLLARIRNFQFGARDVEAVTVNYPIEFLPY